MTTNNALVQSTPMKLEHEPEIELITESPDLAMERAACLSNKHNTDDELGALLLEPSCCIIKADHSAESINIDHSALDSSSLQKFSTELSRPLWWLYCIHGGFTLALPSTTLMFLINSHIQMPLNLLPTYGAIAFMPFSLKPLYAYFAWHRRDVQLTFFLLCDALLWITTARVQSVSLFVVLAFLRGITSAWPEFLLGLSLVEEASSHDDERRYEQAAANMQAQAATARNAGSLAAYGVGLLFLGVASWRKRAEDTSPLDLETAFWIILATSFSSMTAACIAYFYQVGRPRDYFAIVDQEQQMVLSTSTESSSSDPRTESLSVGSYQSSENLLVDSGSHPESGNTPPSGVGLGKGAVLVVVLQVAVILLALKNPVTQYVSEGGKEGRFYYVFGGFLFVVVSWGYYCYCTSTSVSDHPVKLWTPTNRVGLFLILRNMVPSAGYLLLSFRYEVFVDAPLLLQLFSILESAVITGASWTFGNWLSDVCAERAKIVLAVTTAMAAVVSLSEMCFVHVAQGGSSSFGIKVAVAVVTSALTTWTGEWSFLPHVILATMVLKRDNEEIVSEEAEPSAAKDSKEKERQQRGIQYGSLITCIDFGDQLGALLTGSLVSILGVTRENDWNHLESFIFLCALMTLFSISLLTIVR